MVFGNVSIEGLDLVKSLREPGGNITGVRSRVTEQVINRFEVLHETVPQAKRIYGAYDPNYPGFSFVLDQLRKAISATDVELVEAPCTNVTELQMDLDTRAASEDIGIDAILILPTSLTSSPEAIAMVSKFATDHRLPIAGSTSFSVEKGALFNNAVFPVETGQLAATLAAKIFKGVPTGTIPILSGDSHLRINYKVAQELGLTIPEGLLKQAVEIIR